MIKKFFANSWKWIKVVLISLAALIVIVIGVVIYVMVGKKIGETRLKKYSDKLNKLLQEKLKNEKIIDNSSYNNYNDDGTIK